MSRGNKFSERKYIYIYTVYTRASESGADSGLFFAAGAVSGLFSSDYFLRTGTDGTGVRGSQYFDGKK